MSGEPFVDYYELLQLSPAAEADTIQRVFRLLAQRYHPDNRQTGNEQLFQSLLRAYQVLSDPAERAAYDIEHQEAKRVHWQVFDQKSAVASGPESEKRKREGILGVLYRKRQMQPEQPGMNLRELEDVLSIPKEHLEFAIWFLKESQSIKPGDNGRVLITVKGAEAFESLTTEPAQTRSVYMLAAPKDAKAS
jgi:curved DNA-binding protein CbpA